VGIGKITTGKENAEPGRTSRLHVSEGRIIGGCVIKRFRHLELQGKQKRGVSSGGRSSQKGGGRIKVTKNWGDGPSAGSPAAHKNGGKGETRVGRTWVVAIHN